MKRSEECPRCSAGPCLQTLIGIQQAPEFYKLWQEKAPGVTKMVIDPWQDTIANPVVREMPRT